MKSPIPVLTAEPQPGEKGNGHNPVSLPLLDPDTNPAPQAADIKVQHLLESVTQSWPTQKEEILHIFTIYVTALAKTVQILKRVLQKFQAELKFQEDG